MLRRRVQRRTRLIKQQQPHPRILAHHRTHKRPTHRQPLHLPPTQRGHARRLHAPRTPDGAVVHVAPEQRFRAFWQPGVVVTDGSVQVRVESLWELLDELLRASEASREANVILVCSGSRVPYGNVVAYLYEGRSTSR